MKKQILLFLMISFSINSADMMVPSTETINKFIENFADVCRTGAINDSTNQFVKLRIKDLAYFKSVFKSSLTSKRKALAISAIFTIPLIAKFFRNQFEEINKGVVEKKKMKIKKLRIKKTRKKAKKIELKI